MTSSKSGQGSARVMTVVLVVLFALASWVAYQAGGFGSDSPFIAVLLIDAAVFGLIARKVRRDEGGRFQEGLAWGAVFGPIGLLIVAVTKPPVPTRECPHCRERMHRDATACPHCQRTSRPEDV